MGRDHERTPADTFRLHEWLDWRREVNDSLKESRAWQMKLMFVVIGSMLTILVALGGAVLTLLGGR